MKSVITTIIAITCASSPLVAVEQKSDILNFQNNDTIHGEFLGYNPNGLLIWKTPESTTPIEFDTKKIRKVVFKGGFGASVFSHSSLLTLSNGDTLPCKLESLDDKQATVTTDFAGKLTIQRKHIASIAINPLGSKLLYSGPFSKDDWEIPASAKSDDKAAEKKSAWEFGNFSWYNNGALGSIINRSVKLPENYLLGFHLESSTHSNVALVFQADFKKPATKDKNKDVKEAAEKPQPRQNGVAIELNIGAAGQIAIQQQGNANDPVTAHFGSCLVLRLNAGNPNLCYYGFNEDGSSAIHQIPTTFISPNSFMSVPSMNQRIELRVSNTKKSVSLYRNDALICQWSLENIENYKPGTGFGFSSIYEAKSLVRISEVNVAPWNQVIDPAISLQHEERDIIMLSNGTDRFSGNITGYANDQLAFDGSYSEMNIPANEIQSIHFAKKQTADAPETNSSHLKYRFYNNGFLSAKPVGGDNKDTIKVTHPILGALTLRYAFLSSIDFSDTDSLIDDWNRKL